MSEPKRPQDVAAKKLAQARQQVAAKTKALKRLATSLRFWERKAQYFAKQASLTDAELAARKAARIAKAAQKPGRRGIKLEAGTL